MPHDPGPAAWNSLLPPIAAQPELTENVSADFLVIGAGFAGLSAAQRLRQLNPTQRIIVLDATRVAAGPAGRNSGFMIDVPHDLSSDDYGGDAALDSRDTLLNRAGIAYALAAKERHCMSDEAIVVSGKINGAITPRGVKHNQGYASHLSSLSEPFEILDAAQMQEITGSASYVNGLFTPGTAMLQPALYIRNLAQGIVREGVSLYENSPVLDLIRQGSSWIARTPRGKVQAPKVILSVNGHLESFGFFKNQLMHVYTYGSMTRALSKNERSALGGQSRWALTPADPLGTTVRRISGTGGDRLIIRNRATFDPSISVSEGRIPQIAKTHDRSFIDRFPQLKQVEMEYRWGGRLCLSRNNVSVFGEIETNLYSACCQNGLGTAKGTVSGMLAAELACEQKSELLNRQLSFDEPRKLPPSPLATVGANAVLRWGEFRAGKEL